MKLKEILRLLIPSKLLKALKLRRIRSRVIKSDTLKGEYIQSEMISPSAILDGTTEIADDVYIGDYGCIGRHTYIQRGSEVLSARIGHFCSIGTNCHIGMFEHPLYNISTSSRLYLRILRDKEFYSDIPKPALIGNDVWIGSNATVLGGCTIGDGAVIGAGAVVTKDIPPYGIAVGVPAKVIRYRFTEEKIKALLDLKWWNWEDSKIVQNKALFETDQDTLPGNVSEE